MFKHKCTPEHGDCFLLLNSTWVGGQFSVTRNVCSTPPLMAAVVSAGSASQHPAAVEHKPARVRYSEHPMHIAVSATLEHAATYIPTQTGMTRGGCTFISICHEAWSTHKVQNPSLTSCINILSIADSRLLRDTGSGWDGMPALDFRRRPGSFC